jgi:hypothetical protein
MKLLTLCFFSFIALASCVSGIESVDTKNKNGACVRQCTGTYSSCIGNAFGIAAQNNCGGAFKVCANTCPDK